MTNGVNLQDNWDTHLIGVDELSGLYQQDMRAVGWVYLQKDSAPYNQMNPEVNDLLFCLPGRAPVQVASIVIGPPVAGAKKDAHSAQVILQDLPNEGTCP